MRVKTFVFGVLLLLGATGFARAAIVITEVDPAGSAATYAADWFELKNTGAAAVDITGWKVDDNSHSFAAAVALRGITSIAPGQSVVFTEGNTAGTNDATIQAAFVTAWFGATAPVGFTIAGYGGSGIGLSSTAGDEVNIYDSTGTRITGVGFGATTTGVSLDNIVGVGGTTDPLPIISTNSAAGVNGAFLSPSGETGSPGNVATPEPSGLAVMGLLLLGLKRYRRQ